ncbi:MAG: hypothetical protein ACEQSA_01155 [Weeksellaceae bacterium]
MNSTEYYLHYRRPSTNQIKKHTFIERTAYAVAREKEDENYTDNVDYEDIPVDFTKVDFVFEESTTLHHEYRQTANSLSRLFDQTYNRLRSNGKMHPDYKSWLDRANDLFYLNDVNSTLHGLDRFTGNTFASEALGHFTDASHKLLGVLSSDPETEYFDETSPIREFYFAPQLMLYLTDGLRGSNLINMNCPPNQYFKLLLETSLLHRSNQLLDAAISSNVLSDQPMLTEYPTLVGAELYELGEAVEALITTPDQEISPLDLKRLPAYRRQIIQRESQLRQRYHKFQDAFHTQLFTPDSEGYVETVEAFQQYFHTDTLMQERAFEIAGISTLEDIYDAYRKCQLFMDKGINKGFYANLLTILSEKALAMTADVENKSGSNIKFAEALEDIYTDENNEQTVEGLWQQLKYLADSCAHAIKISEYELTEEIDMFTSYGGFDKPALCYLQMDNRRFNISFRFVNQEIDDVTDIHLAFDAVKNRDIFDWSVIDSPDTSANKHLKIACMQLTVSALERAYAIARAEKEERDKLKKRNQVEDEETSRPKREPPTEEETEFYKQRKTLRHQTISNVTPLPSSQPKKYERGKVNLTPLNWNEEEAIALMENTRVEISQYGKILEVLRGFNDRLGKLRGDFKPLTPIKDIVEPGTTRRLFRARIRIGGYRVILHRLNGEYHIDRIFFKDGKYE